jgi:DNA polymerase-4
VYMTRHILHIDLDAFFVSVEQALAPELRDKPVIVGGRPDRRGVVASASYQARAFGIRAGMPLAQAYRLCPKAIFLQGSFPAYRDASERFMEILADFSPCLEPAGLDEAYLDITGCEAHGTPHHLALRIKERVKNELGLIASVGMASCKVVAKIASDLGKPDGLVEVPAGKEKEFLAPLPVASLPGVGKRTEQALESIGIRTLGQLAALPPEAIKTRLGAAGVMFHHHANGIDNREVEPFPGEAKSISRETTFAEDTLDRAFLQAILRYLCERVGAELRQEGKYARTVTLKLRYADFETITRRISSKEATDADEVIFAAAVKLLGQALARKRKLVRLIGVGVSNLTGGKQLNLLDSRSQRLSHLDKAIDRIRNRYGFTSIQTGRTLLLRDIFASREGDYILETPSLSR